jgi:hypothetical protein
VTDHGSPRLRRRRYLRAAGAAALGGVAGCLGVGGGPSAEEQARDAAEALSAYESVGRAIDDGYQTTAKYVRTPGVLGVPFVLPERDRTGADPEQPPALLYDLDEDGSYRLLGAKWFAPAGGERPSLFGSEFSGPKAGEAPGIPEHYWLHAWLFEENPEGLFAEFHPGVSPPAYVDDLSTVRDSLRDYGYGTRAEDDGYTNTEACVGTDAGGYGVQFIDRSRAGGGLTDPPVLLYRLTSNWSYQLMGAEWYVPSEGADRPSRFGQEYHDAAAGHSEDSDQPRHYGLHAWLFRANPEGLFAEYNPAFRC